MDKILEPPVIWKPVKGFEETHEVSNYGVVRSIVRTITWYRSDIGKYVSRVFPSKILTEKPRDGYLEVHLRGSGKEAHWSIHKVVSEAFHKDLHLPVVDHIDDDKTNNCLWNLKRCTVSYNTKKAVDNGQSVAGNLGYSRKISEELKAEVRTLLKDGWSMRKIEREYPISQRSIARIRDGEI